MRMKHIIALSGLLFIVPIIKSDAFIFDLGGVLFDTNPMASLRTIGIKNLTQCMIYLKKGPQAIDSHFKRKLFDTLHYVAEIHQLGNTSDIHHIAYDEHGTALPYLMCAWLNGSMTNKNILSLILCTIEDHPEWFCHTAEKQAICNLITMIFTPEHFIATRKLYKHGIRFIKACKKNGHQVYILSNWDSESFALLKEKYALLFDLCDGILISGDSKSLKPSSSIYTTLLERYNLTPQECWFIDDQHENVQAAQALGIKGLVCSHTWRPHKKPNFYALAQQIKEYKGHKSTDRREKRIKTGNNATTINSTKTTITGTEKIS